MLNDYIKNQGVTKTFIHNNNVNQIKVDTEYDGDNTTISINTNKNGNCNNYNITFDNTDLENLLNVQSVNMPIDERLKRDFKKIDVINPDNYFIELPNVMPREIKEREPPLFNPIKFKSVNSTPEELLHLIKLIKPVKPVKPVKHKTSIKRSHSLVKRRPSLKHQHHNAIKYNHPFNKRHISSPKTNEEFIVPLTIDKKSSTSSYKNHKRPKNHITYKVYKKPHTL